MPQARNTQIAVTDTPYYLCMGRCVRRAFLCGVDSASGVDIRIEIKRDTPKFDN